jgi:hypothetical protein
MVSFEVGQKIVCVNVDTNGNKVNVSPAEHRYRGPLSGLTLNAVYTVRSTFISPETGDVCVRLQEIKRPTVNGIELGYGAFRFRPVQKKATSIEIFQKILADVSREAENA